MSMRIHWAENKQKWLNFTTKYQSAMGVGEEVIKGNCLRPRRGTKSFLQWIPIRWYLNTRARLFKTNEVIS